NGSNKPIRSYPATMASSWWSQTLSTLVFSKTYYKVMVQGLGNVGYHAAKFFYENGAIIVGLAEYEGGLYNEKGLNLEDVVAHRKSTGSIQQFPGAQSIANSADTLEMQCDILIPAALENVINSGNA